MNMTCLVIDKQRAFHEGGAQDLDLTSALLNWGIASGSPERLRFVEDISAALGYAFLRELLE